MIRLWNRVRIPRRSDAAPAFIRVPVALAHLGFAVVALSRWLGYSNIVSPAHESPGPAFLTDGGTLLPLWAGAWLVTGALLLYEGLTGRPRVALILYAALAEVWGLSYVVAWVRVARRVSAGSLARRATRVLLARRVRPRPSRDPPGTLPSRS